MGGSMSAQAMEALNKGNRIRYAQVAERRRLDSMPGPESRREAAAILREPCEDWQWRMKVRYLLMSIRSFGPGKMGMIQRRCGLVSGRFERRLEELSERERKIIAHALDQYGRRVR